MSKDLSKIKKIIYLCNGTCCTDNGAEENIKTLRKSLTQYELNDEIHTIRTKCQGFCKKGPIVNIQPENTWYKEVNIETSNKIVTTHILKDTLIKEQLLFSSNSTKDDFKPQKNKSNFITKLFNLSCFLLFLFLFQKTQGQSSINGFIIDATNQTKIEGATIKIKESGESTISQENGVYKLQSASEGIKTIVVSHIGYNVFTTKINFKKDEQKSLNISLLHNVMNLEELVISALSIKKQENKIDQISLQLQPIKSAQDLLRAVPGLFIAQHAGGGKAEQIFVRGIDNDHGTDFSIQMDGIPANMPSHAHGQGYADMHFMIPETIGTVNFFKGPYEASLGDFSVAGAAQFNSKYRLENNIVKLESGLFNTQRVLTMLQILDQKHLVSKWNDNAYFASEYNYTDGFFESKLKFKRFNFFGRYNAQLTPKTTLILSGSYFSSTWNASGQLPLRAIEKGTLSRYGAIDDSEGGIASRLNTNVILDTKLKENQSWKNQFYYSKNIFDLFSNFTFFMNDPINGDEILQWEKRDLFGLKSTYNRLDNISSTKLSSEVGFVTRTDILGLGRDYVLRRAFLSKAANDDVAITNYSLYLDEDWQFAPKWSLKLGFRNELFNFYLKNKIEDNNSGKKTVYRFNPKAQIHFTPTSNFSVYAKWGIGFHSNYAHTAVSKDPTATNPVPQSESVDLGFIMKLYKKSIFNFTAWWTDSGSEFKFISDDGSFENLGSSRKYGIDASLKIQFTDFLWADTNLNYAYSFLREAPKEKNLIPLYTRWNSTGGLTLKLENGINASLRYRFMGERPAIEDGSVYSKPYTIADVVIRYTRPRYEISLSTENIFNTKWDEAQFYDQSQLKNEIEPIIDFHNTPGTPFFLKGSISYFF
ncbi:TonB-dependent receptor [Flavobacterium columnare]|uniref:TonB-dependent receptor domain-containing protein n=1 Tax=Flavobacterium columnare TaxID=996 RepID=UPI0017844385|nr:TonB-dependent receptor [Flavobacterium columnare]QOG90714.1 TonB-dependent receptor [Flavobacterium columnare]QOG93368.1 TonB-dependent receptor [Flavobacterium columnare]QOG96035.1 TonB-dependent receptor [Flavobacterium columnare]QOG98695.1 TonB-dependent receptor [Flavobacterium columnare]QOH01354.1 TonB-dependent receptor [Flavobacterium columnare]